jgi:TetR/AcrR family transcriptional repressor of nem operon
MRSARNSKSAASSALPVIASKMFEYFSLMGQSRIYSFPYIRGSGDGVKCRRRCNGQPPRPAHRLRRREGVRYWRVYSIKERDSGRRRGSLSGSPQRFAAGAWNAAMTTYCPALLTEWSRIGKKLLMARPREFDRDDALQRAMYVFWAKGYAGTSTDDLLQAMSIGRQSMYATFGDKRKLYVEALSRYQQDSARGHLDRLRSSQSAIAGIENLLLGLIPVDDDARALGCMGVGSIGEFGITDAELNALRAQSGARVFKALVERLRAAQKAGEIDPSLDAKRTAAFLQMTMQGIRVAARAGASVETLRDLALFAIDRLKTKAP